MSKLVNQTAQYLTEGTFNDEPKETELLNEALTAADVKRMVGQVIYQGDFNRDVAEMEAFLAQRKQELQQSISELELTITELKGLGVVFNGLNYELSGFTQTVQAMNKRLKSTRAPLRKNPVIIKPGTKPAGKAIMTPGQAGQKLSKQLPTKYKNWKLNTKRSSWDRGEIEYEWVGPKEEKRETEYVEFYIDDNELTANYFWRSGSLNNNVHYSNTPPSKVTKKLILSILDKTEDEEAPGIK